MTVFQKLKMSCWNPVQITEYGVAQNPGESIFLRFNDFSLTAPMAKIFAIGTVVLTNQRVLFLTFNPQACYQIMIGQIVQMNTTSHRERPGFAYFTFNLHNGETFSFQAQEKQAIELSAKLVTMTVQTAPSGTTGDQPVRPAKKIIRSKPSQQQEATVGIQALKNTVQTDIDNRGKLLAGGLSDIEHLKDSAAQLMRIAEQLRAKNDPESKNDLSEVLLALGVPDPISREASGKGFANELARQFSTRIRPVLEKYGGVMSVAEAYCLYNKALGTNYVTPNDFSEAMDQLNRREMGVKINTIEGVTVVILSEKTYQAILNDILSKFGDSEYVTPLIMSKKTSLPISITKNYLLRAEADGHLSRDDSMAGLRFYKNIFDTFELIEF